MLTKRMRESQQSRHINIECFFVANQMKKKHVRAKHCPTDEPMADFMFKSLQRAKFLKFKHLTMNLSEKPDLFKKDSAPPVNKRLVLNLS